MGSSGILPPCGNAVADHGGRSAELRGTPREVFAQHERLEALGLDVPGPTSIARALRTHGVPAPADALTLDEVEAAVIAALDAGPLGQGGGR